MHTNRRITQRALTTIAVLATAALVAAGCGSDDSDQGETTTTSADTDMSMTETAAEAEADAADAEADIVDTAVEAGSFNTLVQAVQAADLEETLRGDGPFTVFAPTDEAFDKLPEGTLDDLLKPENKQQLADILTYHVASGAVMSGDLSDGQKVETVQGGSLDVSIDGSTVKIGDATVTQADIETSNGVIHVIDTVLLPPS